MSRLAFPGSSSGQDAQDAAARRDQQTKKAVHRSVKRLRAMEGRHGGSGTVALATMGSRGVRIIFVAADGTFGDAIVPSLAAAQQVCIEGEWAITGWDRETVGRIAPSPRDRRRMAGTGR